MYILPGLMILMASGISLCALLKQSLALMLPFSALLMILVMYVMSLFGVMGATLVVELALLALLLAVAAVRECRRAPGTWKRVVDEIMSPTMVMFIAFACFIFSFTHYMIAHQWDEFSHWSVTVEDMYYRGRLSTDAAAHTMFQAYPPAMALWEYLFIVLAPTYSDAALYFAYNLYLLLMMLPIVRHISWKNAVLLIPAALIAYMLPYFIGSYYEAAAWHTLYIDHAIALTVMFATLTYFDACGERTSLFVAGAALAVLTLLKSTGFSLALIALLPMVVECFCTKKDQAPKGWTRRVGRSLHELLPLIVPMVAAQLSWKLYRGVVGLGEQWNTASITASAVWQLITGKAEGWRYDAVLAFWKKLNTSSTWFEALIPLTFLGHIAVWLVMAMLDAMVRSEKRTFKKEAFSRLRVWGLHTLGFVIWLISLQLTYLYIFVPEEAANLAGFYRYTGNYFLAMTAFYTIRLFVDAVKCRRRIVSVGCVLVTCAFVLLMEPANKASQDALNGIDEWKYGSSVTGFAFFKPLNDQLNGLLQVDDKVYINTSSGADYFICGKALFPARIQSYGTWGFSGDLTAWRELLTSGGYTHVFQVDVPEEFAAACSESFIDGAPQAMTLYRIVTGDDGQINLERLVTCEQ